MRQRQITFSCDAITCEGLISLPDEAAQAPGLVICHPHPLHGGTMHNNVVRALAEAFTAAGFGVLRFNFRGVGNSTGHYEEGIGEQDDAKAALTYLGSQPEVDVGRLFLAGYSFGARVTLAVAASDPRLRGLIAVAPPVLRGNWPSLTSCHGPKMFFCGSHDEHVPVTTITDLVKDLPDPKRLGVIPDTDHFFVGREEVLAQRAVTLLQELS